MNTAIYVIFITLFFVKFTTNAQSILINEVSSKNENTILDEDYQESDWIELYNNSDVPINLKDYRIYDKENFEKAYILPDTIIQSKQYLLIFASENKRNTSNKWGLDASGFGIASYTAYDGIHFEYLKATDDFDISVTINSFFDKTNFSHVGINFRENLTPESRYIGMFFVPREKGTGRMMYREIENTNPATLDFAQEVFFPIYKVNLKRNGNHFKACIVDLNGFEIECKEMDMSFPNTGYLGIAYSSTKQNVISSVKISDLMLNGTNYDFNNLTGIDFNCDLPGKLYLNNEIHTNFSIKTSGETVYLWNDKGELIDKIETPELRADISYGRFPDGSENLRYFTPPTPRKANINNYLGLLPEVISNNNAGFYEQENLEISLSNDDKEAKIYYTLDGSIPKIDSDSSILYNNSPISINKTTILRAIATRNEYLQSDIKTYTYFMNTDFRLPVISVVADPYDLYDTLNGLLSARNTYTESEIKGNFEYWNEKKQQPDLALRDGIKRHGHGAALSGRSSIRVYARDEYEDKSFKYNFFGNRTLKDYKRLVIRNSGQDWENNYFRDAFIGVLSYDIGTMVTSAYKPITLYINGSYQGLFNLREHMSTKTISTIYNISEESINFMEDDFFINDGSSRTFWELYNYVDTNDINTNKALEEIDKRLDIDNIIDYCSTQMIFNNFDWSDHNNKFWMSTELDSKWRWILWDLDWSLGLSNAEANSPKTATLFKGAREDKQNNRTFAFFVKLLTNDSIKTYFLNRVNDLMNFYYTEQRLNHIADSLLKTIRIELDYHRAANPSSCIAFDEGIVRLKDFAHGRPFFLRNSLKEALELDTFANIYLSINNTKAGKIKVSTIIPDTLPWVGTYFTQTAIPLKAISNDGFKFVRWEGAINSTEEEITITLDSAINLRAIFRDESDKNTNLVINEIMYRTSPEFDSGDWIELFNANNTEPIDLTNLNLICTNGSVQFSIPNVSIPAQTYMLICQDSSKFQNIYNIDSQLIGGLFYFDLNATDFIIIRDESGLIYDVVSYGNSLPWPVFDGTNQGGSIELESTDLDNTDGKNWKNYSKLGSPGRKNTPISSMSENINIPQLAQLLIIPNPTSSKIKLNLINIDLINSIRNVDIIDIQGNLVRRLLNYNIDNEIDISNLSNGTYLLVINSDIGLIKSQFVINR
ncbi:MAG TPA: CotH kinase family protein [Candidatus Kapabacteria bacterium]|nr:CotH kinase family protein [Candidatus Kapabacteria bacterium]